MTEQIFNMLHWLFEDAMSLGILGMGGLLTFIFLFGAAAGFGIHELFFIYHEDQVTGMDIDEDDFIDF
jgi:hypothetical protein